MSWWSRVANVLRSDRLARELDEEQRFHLEARTDALIAAGAAPEEARAEAARRFGRPLQLREASRDVKLAAWLDSLGRDVRLGIRLLRRDAIVSWAAILSLGLAIGACAAAFALIDALILRELPVPEPGRLVYVAKGGARDDGRLSSLVSYPFFERVREARIPQLEVFSLSYQSLRQATLPDSGGLEEKVETQFVSGNAFAALGVRAALGRLLAPSDDVTPGAHQVTVVSHAFWTRRLGADPNAVGRWIRIEQQPYQIIGVAQAGFTGTEPGVLTDVWLTNHMSRRESLQGANWNWLTIWGRLGPSANAAAQRSEIGALLVNFAREHEEPAAEGPKARPADAGLVLQPASTGPSDVRDLFARPLLALAVIVAVVLLIACSNVANLLLARGAARTREMALRSSIGAGRLRLVQQVLIEAGVLTAAAAAVGMLCAMAAGPLLVELLTTHENPVYLDVRLDWRIVGVVAALGCLTTIVFGLVPALRASSARPADSGAGDRRHTTHAGVARPLVAIQAGFSLMILFVALLLLRSFDRLLAVDLGFRPDGVTVLSIETRERLEPPQARAIAAGLLDRVRALPGVDSVSLSSRALFRAGSWGAEVGLPGGGRVRTSRLAISPAFFQTMDTRLIEGRELVAGETDASSPMPVVVNQAFARAYFPGRSPVGQRLSGTNRGQPVALEIVGVVPDVRDRSIRTSMGPYVFSPIGDPGGTMQVRSSLEPGAVADLVREALPGVHPSLRLVDVTRQTALVQRALLRERLLAVLSGFFAALGLALAALGLYGVSAYAVVRRTREIGIRLTLGARPAAVLAAVLGRVARAVALGLAAGLAGGLYFARFLRTLLFEVEPTSVSSLSLPVVALVIVALAAAWVPARRALRVDPAVCLRME